MSEFAGLYAHIPFCARVCPYCDFAVLTGGPQKRGRFVAALLEEIALVRQADDLGPFDTLYLGGGTPSNLDPGQLEPLLEALRRELNVSAEPRIAMEANPEDVTPEALRAWRLMGVESLSIGAQSFDDAELAFLGRTHDGSRSRQAVAAALAAGFHTVSVDLMFALPGQRETAWRRNLDAVRELRPQHVSCYQLTVHEGTRFGRQLERGTLHPMPDEAQAEMLLRTHRELGDLGYEAYEVSNFARSPEHRSAHNTKYWRHLPYLGLGPGAHSFDGHRTRWWNERRFDTWQRRLAAGERPVASLEVLDPAQIALEALLLGLRTTAGVDREAVRDRTGLDLWPPNEERFARLQREALVQADERTLRPTLSGLLVAEYLAREIEIPAAVARRS